MAEKPQPSFLRTRIDLKSLVNSKTFSCRLGSGLLDPIIELNDDPPDTRVTLRSNKLVFSLFSNKLIDFRGIILPGAVWPEFKPNQVVFRFLLEGFPSSKIYILRMCTLSPISTIVLPSNSLVSFVDSTFTLVCVWLLLLIYDRQLDRVVMIPVYCSANFYILCCVLAWKQFFISSVGISIDFSYSRVLHPWTSLSRVHSYQSLSVSYSFMYFWFRCS